MNQSIRCACIAAAGAFATVSAWAETPALNVKTGLWEMTVQLGGPLPLPSDALARLPPEQRAKMEAMLGALAQPHTAKTCITKEKLSRGALEAGENNGPCRRTVVSNSSNALDLRVECKMDETTMSTNLHLEAPTPEVLKGVSVITRGNRPGTTTGTIQGRWLGADCAGVR